LGYLKYLENKEIYIDMTHTISMEIQTFVELLCTVTNNINDINFESRSKDSFCMLVSIPVN